jgi:myosin-5
MDFRRVCGKVGVPSQSCSSESLTPNFVAVRYEVFISPGDWQKFEGSKDLRPICSAILENSLKDQEKYQIGLTKIFFRPGMVSVLDRMKKQRLDAIALVIQKTFRGYIARKRYGAMRTATVRIQALARGIMARRLAQNLRREKAVLAIQSWGRMYIVRRAFLETRSAAIRIQTGTYWKVVLSRNNALIRIRSGPGTTSSYLVREE